MASSGAGDIGPVIPVPAVSSHTAAGDIPGLTEEEKCQLEAVMKKAREFDADEENKMRKPFGGQLCKYTNVVKGWQYRWFVLTPETGMIEYYMMDDLKKNRPRGAIHLAGSVISPGEEDNQSFTITSICGETYKLKASDAKERQFWVNRLRVTAESHADSASGKFVAMHKDFQKSFQNQNDITINGGLDQRSLSNISEAQIELPSSPGGKGTSEAQNAPCLTSITNLGDSLISVKQSLDEAVKKQQTLTSLIEDLPCDGPRLKCLDNSLLLLKATSQATIQCLEQCYFILQQRHLATVFPIGLPPGATVEWVDKYKPFNVVSNKRTMISTSAMLS